MNPWINDLMFAMQNQLMIELVLVSGERLQTGVHSIDEDTDTFQVWDGSFFGDTARKRIGTHSIDSLKVTGVKYPPPGNAA